MSAKHTPGPWLNGYPQRGITGPTASPLVWLDGNAKSHAITCGHELIAAVLHSSAITPEQEANARLIAAAPELLAALLEERRVRLEGQQPDIHWESLRDMRRECYAATDAAIAKATGEAA